ncbi:MAG: hypothetical protein V7678_10385 [Brevundimonas sp.]
MRVALFIAVLAFAGVAQAQSTRQTGEGYQGAHFAVAAPEGASWSLNCGFPPHQIPGTGAVNRFDLEGEGPAAGRLPTDRAWCTLTKTGGEGPVGFALVKDGTPTAAGTNDPAEPARVEIY